MSIFVGRPTPTHRLGEWARYAPSIEQRLKAVAKDGHDYFEFLYVHRDDQARTVQLFAGRHPTGTNDRGQLLIEGGAALVVSQDSSAGFAVVMIFPYEPEGQRAEPIHWAWFDGPESIAKGKWLDDAVVDFARCCRASSVVDTTVTTADYLRLHWLRLQSSWILLRARAPGMKLISWKPSLLQRLWRWIVITFAALATVLAVPSALSTLWGITVPSLLNSRSEKPPTGSPAPASETVAAQPVAPFLDSQTAPGPVESVPTTLIEMPVISGEYTFCKDAGDTADQKLLNLLHDVRAQAGKIAFLNVRIRIDCVIGSEPDYDVPFRRSQDGNVVGYAFRLPTIAGREVEMAQLWLDGGRKPEALRAMYSDNGSWIVIHNADDGRNPLSRFQPHVEGMVDVLFGPYAIKASEDDAAVTFDLHAPSLDSAALQQAKNIADELRQSK